MIKRKAIATEESIIRKHKEHTAAGMRLLTLSESRSDRYSAVWVSGRAYPEVTAQLEEFGIGLGKIGERDPGPTYEA